MFFQWKNAKSSSVEEIKEIIKALREAIDVLGKQAENTASQVSKHHREAKEYGHKANGAHKKLEALKSNIKEIEQAIEETKAKIDKAASDFRMIERTLLEFIIERRENVSRENKFFDASENVLKEYYKLLQQVEDSEQMNLNQLFRNYSINIEILAGFQEVEASLISLLEKRRQTEIAEEENEKLCRQLKKKALDNAELHEQVLKEIEKKLEASIEKLKELEKLQEEIETNKTSQAGASI